MESPWQAFNSWHRDPDFWRGIYSNFLSGLLLSGALALGATAAGLLTIRQAGLILVVAGNLVAIAECVWLIKFAAPSRRDGRAERRLFRAGWISLLVFSLTLISLLSEWRPPQ